MNQKSSQKTTLFMKICPKVQNFILQTCLNLVDIRIKSMTLKKVINTVFLIVLQFGSIEDFFGYLSLLL
jgi:hypothetical protein